MFRGGKVSSRWWVWQLVCGVMKYGIWKKFEFEKHVFPGLQKLSRGGKAREGVPRVVGLAISMQSHPRSLPLHPHP